MDKIVKHQHLLEIIDEHEGVGVDENEDEDEQIALVEEVPYQMEACQRCFAYLVVDLEEP